jgi:hypothetical protein
MKKKENSPPKPQPSNQLRDWLISPETSPNFMSLAPQEQIYFLSALYEANITQEELEQIYWEGPYTNFNWLSAKTKYPYIRCNAKKEGMKCLRPAGHIDGYRMEFHSMRPELIGKKRHKLFSRGWHWRME